MITLCLTLIGLIELINKIFYIILSYNVVWIKRV